MAEKEDLEQRHRSLRLDLQRRSHSYGAQSTRSTTEIQAELDNLWARMEEIDKQVGPLAKQTAEAFSSRWGTPLRSGYDISHLARQVERSADIYTSRVSNFLYATPFAYLRAKRGSMPHD